MFYDVPTYHSYKDFIDRAKKLGPYRGTENQYPIGSRSYSARHFIVEKDGRVRVFYMNREARNAIEAGRRTETQWAGNRHLLTVYPDDTVEFHNAGDQGDNALISRMLGVWAYQCSKKGGAVLEKNNSVYPLFRGAKFKLGSFEMLNDIKIIQRKVNRKLLNENMKMFDEFLNVFPALTRPMSLHGLKEVVTDNDWKRDPTLDTFRNLVERKHYVDAAVCYMLTRKVARHYNVAYVLRYSNQEDSDFGEDFVRHALAVVKTCFRKDVAEATDSFQEYEVEVGTLPNSEWSTTILWANNPVVRL